MITMKRAQAISEFDWILKDDEMFPRIAEDGILPEDFEIPMLDSSCYWLMLNEGVVIGVWCFYPVNSSTLNVHANILKEHREHSKATSDLVLNWFADHAPAQYVKLNAEIPVVYKDVYNFTKKVGFTDEGTNRASIMKGGVLVDQHRLGLTRKEAIALYGELI